MRRMGVGRAAVIFAVALAVGATSGASAVGTAGAASAAGAIETAGVASGKRCAGPGTMRIGTEARGNVLAAVAVVVRCSAWAVGTSYTSPSVGQPYGHQSPLIERWNGTKWSVQRSPASSGSLTSVAALSASDVWAVGQSDHRPLIEHWDGRRWVETVSAYTAVNSSLSGVAVTSPTNAWAVGAALAKRNVLLNLIERWNGTRWQVVRGPQVPRYVTGLGGVTATSGSNAWAVGSSDGSDGTNPSYVYHWNGHRWKVMTTFRLGTNGSLWSIMARTPQDIWVSGDRQAGRTVQPAMDHWDGVRWDLVPCPAPSGKGGWFNSVTAASPSKAWAVGEFEDAQFGEETLLDYWNGRTCQQVKSPDPDGPAGVSELAGISTSHGTTWAVGDYELFVASQGTQIALAFRVP
jgi:hypothetical protein